jgi:hypothetical protein
VVCIRHLVDFGRMNSHAGKALLLGLVSSDPNTEYTVARTEGMQVDCANWLVIIFSWGRWDLFSIGTSIQLYFRKREPVKL